MMMKRARLLVSLSGLWLPAYALRLSTLPTVSSTSRRAFSRMSLNTEDSKALYALGCNLGSQMGELSYLEPGEIDSVLEGMKDTITAAPPQVDLAVYMEKAGQLFNARKMAATEKAAAAGMVLLEQAAAEPGAVKTDSGLVFLETASGDGASPGPTDKVRVHYEGRLVDGTIFDSSIARGEPIEFPLDGVIKGWTEGLQMMKTGGKAKLTIPPDLAYGDGGTGPIPAKATLTFDVELLAVV
ncbi:hypothetical protein AB1Y20_018434 [Prymnesium parvum]|uniref:peptidylprolyl isomerase n=1 Tax=Prymnesium parvum TaxID=97485 RepID=A0AB34JPW5_PRYPA